MERKQKVKGICTWMRKPSNARLLFIFMVVATITSCFVYWSVSYPVDPKMEAIDKVVAKVISESLKRKQSPGNPATKYFNGSLTTRKKTNNIMSANYSKMVWTTPTSTTAARKFTTHNNKNSPSPTNKTPASSSVTKPASTPTVSTTTKFLTAEEPGAEEELVHLAVKLSKAIGLSQSYDDSLTLNSAYFEVMEMINKSVEIKSKHTPNSCVERSTETKCKHPIRSMLTLVANFVHTSNASHVVEFLNSCRTWYPDVKVIAGVSKTLKVTNNGYSTIEVKNVDPSTSETDVWNYLLSSVTTSYVYISRDIYKFSKDTRLESLIDTLSTTMAVAVSSASKDLHTGQWSNGCLQTLFQNYQLKYRHGYHTSVNSCLVCHYLSGPFLTYTHLITKLTPLQKGMTDTSGFSVWFLELLKTNRVVLSCPDSISNTRKNTNLSKQHVDWMGLVKKNQVEVVYLPDKSHLLFGCGEANTQCLGDHPPGMARSWCCLKELGDGVRLVMRECQAAGLFCEVTDGTILGTLKFEGSLPWEIDADLEVEDNNVSTFNQVLVPKLAKLGYKTRDYKTYETIHTPPSDWTIELFPIKSLGSTRLRGSGVSVTQVLLDGEYISTCESPGLLGRNRYGHEIYQHVNHWRKTGAKSSWEFYKPGKFNKCTKPGDHTCLEQFRADGSTQFWIDRIEP